MTYDSIANLKSCRKHEYILCQSTSIAELTNSATPYIKRSGVKEILGEITNQLQEKQNRLHKLDMEPRTLKKKKVFNG